jgi:uncharacterized membrane protein YfcA
LPHALQLLTIVLLSVASGVINAIAGGGTLLTFPALIGLGVSPIVANATSTVALWPGAVTSMFGYRGELAGARKWAIGFAIPSLIGGGVGAWLVLRTSAARFAAIAPWLVLGATALFMVQPIVMRRIRARRAASLDIGLGVAVGLDVDAVNADARITGGYPTAGTIVWQFLVAVYGGYFGAGVGFLTLAVLGFIGLTNIHRMNGLKNWGGLCMNAVAALTFAFSGLVLWPMALAMAVGSMVGGYFGSRTIQRVPQRYVRRLVIMIGLVGGFWLLLHSKVA